MSASLNIGQEVHGRRSIIGIILLCQPFQHVELPDGRNTIFNGTIGVFENTSSMAWNAFNKERDGALEKDVANRELLVLSSQERLVMAHGDCGKRNGLGPRDRAASNSRTWDRTLDHVSQGGPMTHPCTRPLLR